MLASYSYLPPAGHVPLRLRPGDGRTAGNTLVLRSAVSCILPDQLRPARSGVTCRARSDLGVGEHRPQVVISIARVRNAVTSGLPAFRHRRRRMSVANAATVPRAVVEGGGSAHGVLTMLHPPPCSGLHAQDDVTHDCRPPPKPPASGWHPRNLSSDGQRDCGCAEDVPRRLDGSLGGASGSRSVASQAMTVLSPQMFAPAGSCQQLGSCLPLDEVGGFLRDHDGGAVGVPADYGRHHGCVHDT